MGVALQTGKDKNNFVTFVKIELSASLTLEEVRNVRWHAIIIPQSLNDVTMILGPGR